MKDKYATVIIDHIGDFQFNFFSFTVIETMVIVISIYYHFTFIAKIFSCKLMKALFFVITYRRGK